MRYLVLIVAFFLLLWLLRAAFARRSRSMRPDEQPTAELVRCAHCGLHLPRTDSVTVNGKPYCSSEHGRLGAREP